MRTPNKTLGALSVAAIASTRITPMSESLSCFLTGFGFSLLLVSVIAYRFDASKLKAWKSRLLTSK